MNVSQFKMPVVTTTFAAESIVAGVPAARTFWLMNGAALLATLPANMQAAVLTQAESGLASFSDEAISHLKGDSAQGAILLLESFEGVTEQETTAILYHEEGHFINRHLDSGKLGWYAGLKAEIEADRHAVANTSAQALVSGIIKISNNNAKTCLGVSTTASKVIGAISRVASPTWLIRRAILALGL